MPVINDNGIIREMTEQEIAEMESRYSPQMEIENLKRLLAETDYKAIKYAEGLISDEEYEPVKKQRQEWRDRINELEM